MLGKRRKNQRGGVEKEDFTESMGEEGRPTFSSAASGYLEKKASTAPYRWQKRFFVATGKYVRYYGDESCEQLLAAIDLRGAAVGAEGKRVFKLTLGGGEVVRLRAASESERDEWVAALEIVRRDQEVRSPMVEDRPTVVTEATSRVSEVTVHAGEQARLGTRSENVTKLRDRSADEDSVRSSMIATPRNSFPACAAGFLQKKATTHAVAGWQTRFFVACGHYLRYYASDKAGAKLLGAIDLDGVVVKGAGVDDEAAGREFSLGFADGEIRFRASTPEERAQWVSSLVEMQYQRDDLVEPRRSVDANPVDPPRNDSLKENEAPSIKSQHRPSLSIRPAAPSEPGRKRRGCCGLGLF